MNKGGGGAFFVPVFASGLVPVSDDGGGVNIGGSNFSLVGNGGGRNIGGVSLPVSGGRGGMKAGGGRYWTGSPDSALGTKLTGG